MAVIVKFGNLNVSDIEKKLGITFSKTHKKLLEETWQPNVSKPLAPRSWHYFDLPKFDPLFLNPPSAFPFYNL